MTRLAASLIAILAASPLAATEMAVWGTGPLAWVRIAPSEGEEAARVICHNEMTRGHDVFLSRTLTLGGITVTVDVTAGPYTEPDIYEVTPPEGYIAVPPRVSVGEGETVEILIFSLEGMVMG